MDYSANIHPGGARGGQLRGRALTRSAHQSRPRASKAGGLSCLPSAGHGYAVTRGRRQRLQGEELGFRSEDLVLPVVKAVRFPQPPPTSSGTSLRGPDPGCSVDPQFRHVRFAVSHSTERPCLRTPPLERQLRCVTSSRSQRTTMAMSLSLPFLAGLLSQRTYLIWWV